MIRYTVADKDSEKYLKRLIGRRDLEDALMRLDRLTQEEAWMATAQMLKVAHRVEGGVKTVGEQVKCVDVGVQEVHEKLDVFIQGTALCLLTNTIVTHIRLVDKEEKARAEQAAIDEEEAKRSWFFSPIALDC